MELLKYIFFLGIIFIIFSMIWGFFMLIYRLIVGMNKRPAVESYIFKILNMYFLVSLAAMQSLEYLLKPGTPKIIFTLFGIVVLYTYLVGRLERNRMMLQFNQQKINAEPLNMAWESFIILASLVYFSFAITQPHLLNNSANIWFYAAIKDIYNTPVIGWILMVIGFLFLLVNLVKSIYVTANFITWIVDKVSGNNNNNSGNNNNSSNNDGFSDYEIIEDDKIN